MNSDLSLSVSLTALNLWVRWMVSIDWRKGRRMKTTWTWITFQMVPQIFSCVARDHIWQQNVFCWDERRFIVNEV